MKIQLSTIKLDLSFPKNDFSISFGKYNNSKKSPLIKNNNIQNIDSNGKTIYLIFELSNYSGLVIKFSPKKNKNNRNFRKIDEKNSEYFLIKYKEYSKNEEIIYNQYYFNNNSISFSANDNNYIWKVEQITSKNQNTNFDIKYTLNLFNSNEYSSPSILDSISFGTPVYSFDNYSIDNSSKMVIFNINKNDISNHISNYILLLMLLLMMIMNY